MALGPFTFRNHGLPIIKAGVASLASLAYLTGMGVLAGFAWLSGDLPDTERLWERTRPPSVQIVDRLGRDITVRGAIEQDPLPVETLPFYVRQAFIATEDRRFYAHSGIDPFGLSRAMIRNIQAKAWVEGGSTLTQQLTKNVFLTQEQTLTRKMREAMLAIWLERRFTKSEILRLYLSRVYFGGGAYGLEAASELYFDRPPTDLTLSEAAMLAGLLKAPSRLYPVSNPGGASERMAVVLDLMDRQGLLDEGVFETALTAEVKVHRPTSDDPSEYFIDWIWPEVDPFLRDTGQDLIVQVTLDLALQNEAHGALTTHLNPDLGAHQGAIVTLDATGAILALIGGRSFSESQYNRATQAIRQPGSSFKPMVYLTAIKSGLSPWVERVDQPIEIDGWAPTNFKDEYQGLIRLEDALAQSINTVTASLATEVGLENVVATAQSLGLPEFDPFPSLALGAQGVTVLDMAQTYQTFAGSGRQTPAFGIISVSTATGQPLYFPPSYAQTSLMSAEEVRLMNRMLHRVVEQGTGRNARVRGREIAGKTGTTNDHRDAWFVGYAPGVTTAVWVGDDENRPMRRVTGGSIPARIFSDVMSAALADRPNVPLPRAEEPEWAIRRAEEQSEFLTFLQQLSINRESIPPPSAPNTAPAPSQTDASFAPPGR